MYMVREIVKDDIDEIEAVARHEENAVPSRALLRVLVDDYPALLWEEEGKIVAFWISEELDQDILLVRDFAVRRDERYHKFGRQMMEELQTRARSAGYRTLLLVLWDSRGEDFLLQSGWGVIYETGSSRIFSCSLL